MDLAQLIDGPDVLGLAELDRGLEPLALQPGVDLEPRSQIGLLQTRGAEGRQEGVISTDPNIVPPAVE